ncbi:hypothetical protein EYF80_067444 [Liparis tanakae]|uniref:Uncharacterized protein n=1 Tax=Liparis tanakae TaxID=230148 RepID=A0A4Z2E240_9TELE|nr:hypothetical protein EYF80_067444 [Liparis tanakae]
MRLGSRWVGGSYWKILSTKTHLRPAVQSARLSRQASSGRRQIFSECRQPWIRSISMHTQQDPGRATMPRAPRCSPSAAAAPSAPSSSFSSSSSPLSRPAASVASGFSSGTCPVSTVDPAGETDLGGGAGPEEDSSIPSAPPTPPPMKEISGAAAALNSGHRTAAAGRRSPRARSPSARLQRVERGGWRRTGSSAGRVNSLERMRSAFCAAGGRAPDASLQRAKNRTVKTGCRHTHTQKEGFPDESDSSNVGVGERRRSGGAPSPERSGGRRGGVGVGVEVMMLMLRCRGRGGRALQQEEHAVCSAELRAQSIQLSKFLLDPIRAHVSESQRGKLL